MFYKNSSPNSWYCEPNRLFQSVINKVPVVVGNNPPLKEYVEKNNCGVSVDTDGSNIDLILDGINQVLSERDSYVESISKHDIALWSGQEDVIEDIIERLLS